VERAIRPGMYGKQVLAERLLTRSQKACFCLIYCGLEEPFSVHREAGLRYVYPGNLPGLVGDGENTRCPACFETLVERRGFRVIRNKLANGTCFKCGTAIPGRW
jgi:hypothetical protein